ncbi:M48 family metalloprotease [Candidatus Woesearchaeota archaeon]|nr:M48 family metalloprotease [Candidatus Woesearchaeota archaeon]
MVNEDIQIPVILKLKIYLGLLLSTSLFIGLYVILYYLGGLIYLGIGLIPLIFVLFIKNKPIGVLVKRKEHPKLIALVEETAEKLNVSCPDEIYLTADPSISVSGFFKKRLSIGIASIRSLSEKEFQSIIAHEMGHFYGKDTVIGGFFWRVDYSLEKSSEFGKAWYDAIPIMNFAIIGLVVMLFYKVYRFFFGIINYYYSRQMEYRADYVASKVAGSTNFHKGLLNYSSYTGYFTQVGYNSMIQLLNQGQAFVNIYENVHTWYTKENAKKIQKQVMLNDKWSLFSTHPTLKSRLKRIPQSSNSEKSKPAKELFNNFIKLEKDMTEKITEEFHHNITVNRLYEEAVAREGRCQFCGKQYNKLQDLLEHEAKCNKREK